MKNQYIQSTSQGNQYNSDQTMPSDNWLGADGQDTTPTPSVQPQEETPPPQKKRRPAGSGLLSSWKQQQMQQSVHTGNAVGNPASTSLADQVTTKQPAIQKPVTGQTFNGWNTPPSVVGAGPISPYPPLAGMTPPQPGNINAPSSQPLVSQPFQPMAGSQIQTLEPESSPMAYPGTPAFQPQPFMPVAIPGHPQVGWQTGTPVGFQGGPPAGYQGGTPPPFVQTPQGGNGRGNGKGKKGRKKKKRRFPIWARVAVAILTILLIATGSGTWYYYANFAAPLAKILNKTVPRTQGEESASQGRDVSGNILSGKRINVLLLGSDTDQKFQGGYLAQTDIVVSIDPTAKSVTMLSIPRDTWLNAAEGKGMMKLDQAYFYGGIGLSRATIFQDFGIYIDYYAWVGLDGFIGVINTVGGVDIDVSHPITDDLYPDDTVNSSNAYAYTRVYLAPGPQHLDGPTALEYVRSRHADLVGDFGRSARQQQVLGQLKTKLNNPGILTQLPQLAKDLSGYVQTDMGLTDVFALANFARTLSSTQIHQIILGPGYSRTENLQTGTSLGIQSVVILNCSTVLPVIANQLQLGNSAQCNTGISYDGKPTSTSAVATVLPSAPSTSVSAQVPLATAPGSMAVWQTTNEVYNMSTTSLVGGENNLLGMRGLLDLMFTVVCESPMAMLT